MNKIPRLSPTGIEYGDYAWNFASGCGNNVDGQCKAGGFRCWAYSITQRFADRYPNGFKPTIYPEALLSPLYLKKPSQILCAFMGDLFWDCPEFDPKQVVRPNLPDPIPSVCFTLHGTLKQVLFGVIRACPQHTFLFLTKQPQNLPKWSPFPDNCWVGVTATDNQMFNHALVHLSEIRATIKFISLEPLLGRIEPVGIGNSILDWLIIGALTGSLEELQDYLYKTYPTPPQPLKLMQYSKRWSLQPKIEWVEEIVEAADKAGISVFLKDNLKPLFKSVILENTRCLTYPYGELRQEIPK